MRTISDKPLQLAVAQMFKMEQPVQINLDCGFDKVFNALCDKIKDFGAKLGIDGSNIIWKGPLFILGIVATFYALKGAFKLTYSTILELVRMTFKTKISPGALCAEAQVFGLGTAATLFALTFTAVTKTSMNASHMLSFARNTGCLAQDVASGLKPFINRLIEYFTGVENYFGLTDNGGLVDFVSRVEEFVREEMIEKKIQSSNFHASKCIQLHAESLKFRKYTFDKQFAEISGVVQLANLLTKLDELHELALSSSDLVHNRPAPLFVMMSGAPGVGKSKSMEALQAAVHFKLRRWYHDHKKDSARKWDGKHFDDRFTKRNVYARTPCTDYWESYSQQWCVTYNELFSSRTIDERMREANEVLRAVYTSAYPLNFATLKDKGKHYFTSHLVFATTNLGFDDMNNIGLTSPNALLRRITLPVVVTRNEDFTGRNFSRAWTFTVHTYDSDAKNNARDLGLPLCVKTNITKGKMTYTFDEMVEIMTSEYVKRHNDTEDYVDFNWEKYYDEESPPSKYYVPPVVMKRTFKRDFSKLVFKFNNVVDNVTRKLKKALRNGLEGIRIRIGEATVMVRSGFEVFCAYAKHYVEKTYQFLLKLVE
jgi:hypothetical protein